MDSSGSSSASLGMAGVSSCGASMAAGGSYGNMSIKKNGIYHDMPCTIGTMGDIYVYIYIHVCVRVCVCVCACACV
jgi:hypothetical protein